MAKKNKGERMLIEVGPENLKAIAKKVRIYRSFVDQRLSLLKKEVKLKEEVRELVKEAELTRLKDGRIEFEVDDEIVCLMPQNELITIRKKAPKKAKKTKKTKKGTKDQIKAEEEQFEETNKKKNGE